MSLGIALPPPSLSQEWEYRVKPRGTLKVVDLFLPSASALWNYAEGLVTLDKDCNVVPCLAKDLRWIDDRTVEFMLREDVRFHNGQKFNAEAVRVNWEEYKKMEAPRPVQFGVLPDETKLEMIDECTIRFTFPEPDGIVSFKFEWFFQIAPAFFAKYNFEQNNWGRLLEAGPWGTGPFKLVEGGSRYGKPTERVVLEAFEGYWDPRYPKVKRVIFENTLIGNRKEAMRLCRETEGAVDIVSFIRPLDTLKVAESPFGKVVKSRDVEILEGLLNHRKRGSKWRDIRLRKALNYAVNREELWKYGARGNAYNLEGFPIPPGGYGHNPNFTPYTYDTTKARSLLAQAGYPEGFEVKMIANEAWRLEAQIVSKMLERIGLKVSLEVLTRPEMGRKNYIPLLDKPPEEQDWDICIWNIGDYYGHTGATHLTFGYLEESEISWIEYDPLYEKMWNEMARTVDSDAQEQKIRQMAKYLYDRAYSLFIYSPLSLYAVNKQVNFVPQKYGILRLKETSVTDNHWSIRTEKR